ncbi:MAG: hypothetical protein ABFC89_00620 [Methanospirillum sp.]
MSTMHQRERAARLALLAGEPVELARFVVATFDGRVRFAALANPEHADRRFMLDIAETAERHFPNLETYTDQDRVLFSIPITVRQMAGGGWDWRGHVDMLGSVVAACGPRVMPIALRLADEILPIVVAAVDAGELP